MDLAQKVIQKKNIPIRVDFEDVEAEKFETVKRYLGLKQNTEVVRALISEKYNEIQLVKRRRHEQQMREAKALEWLEKGEYKCPM